MGTWPVRRPTPDSRAPLPGAARMQHDVCEAEALKQASGAGGNMTAAQAQIAQPLCPLKIATQDLADQLDVRYCLSMDCLDPLTTCLHVRHSGTCATRRTECVCLASCIRLNTAMPRQLLEGSMRSSTQMLNSSLCAG